MPMFQFHSFQVGSAVYYVLFDGPRYRIRKTRFITGDRYALDILQAHASEVDNNG